MRHLEPSSLGKRTREIVEYYLSHPSLTRESIGKALGISQARVSAVLNSSKVQQCYPIICRGRVTERLLPKAMQAYERLIERSANDAVVEKAAGRVLASENVFDGPKLTVVNQIDVKNLDELRAIVNNAASLPQNVIDSELVDEKDA